MKMIFKTMTSTYEITKERDNLFKLHKLTVDNGYSAVSKGQEFHAGVSQIFTFGEHDNIQLMFGNMNTSVIPEYKELEKWLKDNGIRNN